MEQIPQGLLTGGLVGAIVGLIGVLLNQYFAGKRHHEDLRHASELAAQRAHEESLQNYFEQVGKLLVEHHLSDASANDNLSTVARAQTLAVLEGLDPERKRILLQFLYQSNLIKKGVSVISLERANLSEANLSEVNLKEANLERANLRRANLFETDLKDANLKRARLTGAHLFKANLRRADLESARLREADLREADLEGADLKSARLGDADLRGAMGVTDDQLDKARTLEGATMPDGSKHD